MCSDRNSAAGLRGRIVTAFLKWAALIYIAVAAAILAVTWLYLKAEYTDFLDRAEKDLVAAYAEFNGSIEAMDRYFANDAEEHGADRVWLFLAAPDGAERLSLCADSRIRSSLAHLAAAPSPAREGRIVRSPDSKHPSRVIARWRISVLPDGSRLAVAHNVTRDEYYLIFLSVSLAAGFFLVLGLGALAADSLARRLVKALKDVSDAAAKIRSGDWAVRAHTSQETREIAALGEAFNMMCDANENYVNELKTLADDIAHDLRTPLTRLYAAAESGTLPEGELRGIVAEQIRAMLEMINTNLEISRAGCAAGETPGEEIELASFIQSLVELYSTVAEDGGITLAADCPDPVAITANRSRIQRLLGNLLDNAIKHTPQGGSITVSCRRTGDMAEIKVKDTGEGIAPADLPHIFKRFWRADSSRTRPGNGLGLALVKAIAEGAGGTVSCISSPGEGAEFTVRLKKIV